MDVYQRRRLVALSVIAGIFILFVLLIRSCGGDDETTPEPLAGASGASGAAGVTVLSVDDYVAQADPICLEANTSLADVDESDPVQADSDKAQIVASELQQLQTLPAPDGNTGDLEDFLSALEKQSAAYDDRSTASERGDDATVVELDATIDKAAGQAEKAAKSFGFEVCGDTSKVGESDAASGGDETTTEDTATDTATDTGAVAPAPVTPTTTTPVPVAPPTDDAGGAATPAPAPAPTDTGGAGDGGTGGSSSSGGVSP